MKILYFTDAHIKGATPSGRSDVYYIAILKKLVEIEKVVEQEKVDFVIIGGDLFDIPNVSLRIYSLVARLIRKWKAKVFVVPGNHDVFGQSIESLSHTSLGALASSGVVTIVTRDTSPICLGKRSEPNNILALNGQEYYADIDTGTKDDYDIDMVKQNAFNLLVVHGFAVTKAFHPDVPHTVIKNITTDADLILTGHYHPDRYEETTANGVQVLKPRGFGRVEASKHNIDHKPDYLLLEIENSQLKSYEFRELQCAADGKDIFDAQYVANASKKQHKATLTSFTQSITDVDLKETMSTKDMIKQMANNVPGVTQDHALSAIKLLIDSEKGVSDKELDGFIPQNKEINIVEVELENFQSHKHTVIKLDPTALNVFIGASHSGKTAAIRALNWIFYNDPKGSDMINQSESKCSASVLLDTGMKLTRFRTKTSSGGYIVEDTNKGTTVEFNKFANNIPIEVFNAHQMPKIVVGKEKISLNFGMQLDGPFMLSMTGSERATTIGNITGADVVDEAVAIASGKIINLQKGIKTIEADIKEVEDKIVKYDNLPDDKAVIAEIELLLVYINGLDNRLKKINELTNYININKNNIDAVQNKLSAMPDVNAIGMAISDLEVLQSKYSRVSNLEDECNAISTGIESCNFMITKCAGVDEAKVLVDDLALLQERYASISELEKSCSQLDQSINNIDLAKYSHLDELASLISELDTLNNTYNIVHELGSSYKKIKHDIGQIQIPVLYSDIDTLDPLFEKYQMLSTKEAELIKVESSIAKESQFIKDKECGILNITDEYRDKLKLLGECPVCNSVLSEDKISTISL